MTTPLPQFSQTIGQSVLLEPLNGPGPIDQYLGRFPEALYTRSPDSHFMRFMYAILGPTGTGWLRANYQAARLRIEASGALNDQLDQFYANPFQFGRLLDETSEFDTAGLLNAAQWDQLRTSDESYRTRAIQFLQAARYGGTPLGMKLAASSGAGQVVDVYENYQWLFDQRADIPLGLPHYGSTLGLGEFTIVPRQPISRTVQQTIDFTQVSLGTEQFTVNYQGYTAMLNYDTSSDELQAALWALPPIGNGNALVAGGPGPSHAFVITFTGDLANQVLPDLGVTFVDTFGVTHVVPVIATTGGIDPSSEVAIISQGDRHLMQDALDRLRPVASYPTFSAAVGPVQSRRWTGILASSEYIRVVKFITGSASVSWPSTDNVHWVQSSIELEAPQLQDGVQMHYTSFHNVASITSYTDVALNDPGYALGTANLAKYISLHIGTFPEMRSALPYFAQFTDPLDQFVASRALADYPDPLTVSAITPDGVAVLDNIYPVDYASLQGVPLIRYKDDAFWSSAMRESGADILEIDLGTVQAVNFISFELTGKPVDIAIDYDLLDQAPQRRFVPAEPMPNYPVEDSLYYDPAIQSPWRSLSYWFNDGQQMIYTRFIRLTFTRRQQLGFGGFLFDPLTGQQMAYSIDVRNLRVGRNVAPAQL